MLAHEARYVKELRDLVAAWSGDGIEDPDLAKAIRWAPELFTLTVGVSDNPGVGPDCQKALMFARVYMMDNFDLIPEVELGAAGLVDDVLVLSHVLVEVAARAGTAVVEDPWSQDGPVLPLLETVRQRGDAVLGAGRWRILRRESGLV